MDVNALLAPLVSLAWSLLATYSWLIALALLVAVLRTPWAKGLIGELLVRLCADLMLDKKAYLPFHNVTLTTPDGTTQIDHVFVSPYGVFVVETKNMSGWIFGTANQAQWTQKFYRKTFKFQNPLRQNYKHIKALEQALEVEPEHLHSVITFVGGARIKTDTPDNVTQGIGFIRYIKGFKEPVFSSEQVTLLASRLRTGRLAPTLATHRAHVQNLKRRADPTAERSCPKCGSALVIRTIKAGSKAGEQFWGCTAYPKCRVMQSVG